MGRLKHPFVLSALCLFLALGTVAKETRSSEPAGDGLKRFGLFPLWLSLPADNPMASEELVSSWTEAVLSDLQNSEAGEWIPLDLPGFADEGSRVRFDTLIGKGLEAGCSGILVLQVHQLDFKTKEVEIGRLSFVNASCEVALTGSLVDVGNRAAAGEFSSESRLKDNNYKGPEPGDVESEPIDSESVRTSLFGKAIAEIRQDLVRKITQNTGIIETRIRPALSRSEAPEGVRFAQESMDLRLTTANDQRFTVQVTNAGDEAETFVVKPLNRIGGVVMGLKGIGSEDEPCRLSPGEWKFIRLIANARPQAAAGAVVLGLVKTPEGDEDESTGTAVHDRMTLNITPGAQPADVDMKVLRQDPATLRAVCQLHNRGREEGTVSVRAGETTGGSVVITPPLEDHPLAAGRSMLFFVQPVFESRSRRIEADVEYDLGGRVLKKRLLFEIPPGKEMFWGVCGTSQSSSGSPGVCLN
ncbi:MAG: hypothetical protein JW747_00860, partial [Candidatus Aminicenantes bacterium]|nr:hypothetical protein [Candidatus Aminicenantes bacterium]